MLDALMQAHCAQRRDADVAVVSPTAVRASSAQLPASLPLARASSSVVLRAKKQTFVSPVTAMMRAIATVKPDDLNAAVEMAANSIATCDEFLALLPAVYRSVPEADAFFSFLFAELHKCVSFMCSQFVHDDAEFHIWQRQAELLVR